ncbi:MAG: hypothetical protein MI740_05735 [Halanaerobiales bacterium]|nr:hypothetical protein [Halanaerobiales bacterium]
MKFISLILAPLVDNLFTTQSSVKDSCISRWYYRIGRLVQRKILIGYGVESR